MYSCVFWCESSTYSFRFLAVICTKLRWLVPVSLFLPPPPHPTPPASPRPIQTLWAWNVCYSQHDRLIRVPKGGGGPWSPGALKFLLTGALILFWLWSPEPKDILRGARSPAFSSLIIRVPRLHWFLITAFLCLFVRINGHKETESEERTVHNTSICVISVYNEMQ